MQRQFVQIVAEEFASAMLDYPILFTKHPETAAFYPGVMMGFLAGENLYADACGNLSDYLPADLLRQGFFVQEGRIVIDRDSPVFGRADGESLFDQDGEVTPAFRRVERALQMLDTGLPATDQFIERMLAHKLLEPIDITMDFDDGQRIRLDGLYTISLDRIHALPDEVALDLLRRGDLRLAYAQIGSVAHLRKLARRRNDRLTGQVA